MSRHTLKAALVPSAFFDPAEAAELLSRTVKLGEEDKVEYISLPELSAELVYSHSEPPELYYLLKKLQDIKEYNKINWNFCSFIIFYYFYHIKSFLNKNSALCRIIMLKTFIY